MTERVVIVGAGVMGCACAYRLLEAGCQVTLLERATPGAESSAAAAGILGAQSEVSGPGPYQELCLASRALYRDYVRELAEVTGIQVDYESSGVLEVALDAAEGRLVVARAEWMLERGQRVEVLDRAAVLALEPALTPELVGANYYPDDHQLDPVRLAAALAAAVARRGGEFRKGVRVTGLALAGERVVGVLGERETLAADWVVIAAGAWSTALAGLPALRTTIKPLAGQMMVWDTRPPLLRHVVYGLQGYIVPRADGRVLTGSTLEERGFDKAVTAAGLHRISGMALNLAPSLAEARLNATWSGLRPAPADGLPLLGAGPLPGLLFATGHYRNGILLTPITGEVIRDLVMGRAPALDVTPFAP